MERAGLWTLNFGTGRWVHAVRALLPQSFSENLFGYGSIPTIFSGMNIHVPAILMFTRGTRFWHTAIWLWVDIWVRWIPAVARRKHLRTCRAFLAMLLRCKWNVNECHPMPSKAHEALSNLHLSHAFLYHWHDRCIPSSNWRLGQTGLLGLWMSMGIQEPPGLLVWMLVLQKLQILNWYW